MLHAALLILLGEQAVGLDRHISYETLAKPASAVLQELSGRSGVTLRASEGISGDMLVVRMKDVSVKDAMDRIAQATTAQWEQKDGTYWLVRTQAAIDRLNETDHADELKTLRAELAGLRAELAKQGPITARTVNDVFQWQQEQNNRTEDENNPPSDAEKEKIATKDRLYQRLNPEQRVAMGLVAANFTAEGLMALKEDERTVFAMRPNELQKPLKGDSASVLQEYNQERRIWDRTMTALEKAIEPPHSEEEGAIVWNPSRWAINPYSAEDASRALVIVTRTGAYVRLGVLLADAKGQVVIQNDVDLNQWQPEGDDSPSPEPPGSKGPRISIDLSPLAAEFLNLCHSGDQLHPDDADIPVATSWSKELVTQLVHPEDHEPLASFPSELMLGVAKARNKNLVACLADSILSVNNASTLVPPMTDVSVMKDFQYDFASMTEKDGWIVGAPDPRNSKDRLDRHLFGELLKQDRAAGRRCLDPWATFIANSGPDRPYSTYVAESIVKGLFGDVGEDYWDSDGLLLYGSFSPGQRRAMAAGMHMPVRTLNPDSRKLVETLVYGAQMRYAFSRRSIGEQFLVEADGTAPKPRPTTVADVEMTEALPHGLPATAEIGLTDTMADQFLIIQTSQPDEPGEEASQWRSNSSIEQLAELVLQFRKPELYAGEAKPVVAPIRRTKVRTVNMTIRLGEQVLAESGLTEKIAVPGTFDCEHLPPDVEKAIQPLLVKAEKDRREMLKGQDEPPPRRSS